jgi:hypothetical protein
MPLPLQYGERIHCLDFKTGTRKNCSINFLVHSHNPIYLVLFSFGDGRGVLDFVVLNAPSSHYVPIKFSMDFKHVPQVLNVLPNMFPISPLFVPYDVLNIVLLEPI